MTDRHDPLDKLTPQDAAALDALVEAGFELGRVAPEHRARAERLAAMLAPVALGEVRPSPLGDAILARIDALDAPAALSSLDAEALDSWMQHDHSASRVPGLLRERAYAHEALSSLATDGDAPSARDARIDSVLAALDAADDLPEPVHFERAGRWGWREIVSVAATVLLGVSILWPILSTSRHFSERSRCESQLSQVAMALGGYATDNADAMPLAAAGFGGGTWWNVGQGRGKSNSANLYVLPSNEYTTLADLACPGNPLAPTAAADPDADDWRALPEVSYSYRIPTSGNTERLSARVRFVVLSDRSPVIPHAIAREPMRPDEPSPNHHGRGQHILFSDGSATWTTTPVLSSGDNVWLPAPVERAIESLGGARNVDPIRGVESPESASDAFVGP